MASAYAMLLAGIKSSGLSPSAKLVFMKKAADELINSRPTAVNLKWAVEKMMKVVEQSLKLNPENYILTLQEAATDLYNEDISTNIKMSDFGARLLKKDSIVITHCNAGALATAGYGTALGMIRTAYKNGKIKNVFAQKSKLSCLIDCYV